MRLTGKSVLITGGNSGIGEAMVRLFTREGAEVVFAGRRAEVGEALQKELDDQGYPARFVAADVRDEASVIELVKQATEVLGRLDVVVNCAGGIAPPMPIEQMDVSTWDDLMATNVRGMFLVCKHTIPELRKTRGSIINLGSTFGHVGAAGSAAYALTKAAAVNFSKSLALELAADGVRVNALCPGGTDTGFLRDWLAAGGDAEGAEKWLLERHPLGRLGTPDEQARAALFLASDDASYITGQSLLVDGGYTAQ